MVDPGEHRKKNLSQNLLAYFCAYSECGCSFFSYMHRYYCNSFERLHELQWAINCGLSVSFLNILLQAVDLNFLFALYYSSCLLFSFLFQFNDIKIDCDTGNVEVHFSPRNELSRFLYTRQRIWGISTKYIKSVEKN